MDNLCNTLHHCTIAIIGFNTRVKSCLASELKERSVWKLIFLYKHLKDVFSCSVSPILLITGSIVRRFVAPYKANKGDVGKINHKDEILLIVVEKTTTKVFSCSFSTLCFLDFHLWLPWLHLFSNISRESLSLEQPSQLRGPTVCTNKYVRTQVCRAGCHKVLN